MRALLVRGQRSICVGCLLSEEGDRKAARTAYAKGCAALEAVSHPAEGGGHRDRHARARADARDAGAAVSGGRAHRGARPVVCTPRSGRWNRAYARGRRCRSFCPWAPRPTAALAGIRSLPGARLADTRAYTEAERGARARAPVWPDRSLLGLLHGIRQEVLLGAYNALGPVRASARTSGHSNRESSSTAAAKMKLKWRNPPKTSRTPVWVVLR